MYARQTGTRQFMGNGKVSVRRRDGKYSKGKELHKVETIKKIQDVNLVLGSNKNLHSKLPFQNTTLQACFHTKTSFSAFINQNLNSSLRSRYPKRFIRQTRINQITVVQSIRPTFMTQPTPGVTSTAICSAMDTHVILLRR